MKKLVFFAFIFFIIFIVMLNQGKSDYASGDMDYKVIPDEAIRLRILANSDSAEDQRVKRAVRDAVNASISDWVKDITDINEARDVIQERLPEIKEIIGNVLKQENQPTIFTAEYGKNITFPAKLYGSYLYPAGEYEAVLITLGEGKGANWWCVLFPPLCFLDFGNGTTVAEASPKEDEKENEEKQEEEDEVEVKFFLFEWFDWL